MSDGWAPKALRCLGCAVVFASVTTAVARGGLARATPASSRPLIFSKSSALPGDSVTVRTVGTSRAARTSAFVLQLYLVSATDAAAVVGPKDSRLRFLGTIRLDRHRHGMLNARVPELVPGDYLLARLCASCAMGSGWRGFAVLKPSSSVPVQVRAAMALHVNDSPAHHLCDAEASTRVLADFLAALNRGEDSLVERFLTTSDSWIWWRDPEHMTDPVPYAQLSAYFASLQNAGTTLELSSLRLTSYRTSPPLGQFAFRVTRGGSSLVGFGKGAVDCATGRLALVTIDTW
jgi:hypothetical protein